MALGRFDDLSIIVLSYNRVDELQANIPHHLKMQEERGAELIVVDNASNDGSAEYLAGMQADIGFHLAEQAENLGVAGGRNAGLRRASRPYVMIVDDDTWLRPQHVAPLLGTIRSQDDLGVVFPRMIDLKTQRELSNYGDVQCEPGNFMGGCHLLRASAIVEVGLFDERCRFGGEEFDYSLRLRNRGWRVMYVPDVTVAHNGLARDPSVDRWRRLQWIFNYVRILFKNFGYGQAGLYATRMVVRQALSGARRHRPGFVVQVTIAALRGAVSGRCDHHAVSSEVAKFYRDRDLLPDCGNRPLFRDAVLRLRRRVLR